MSSFAFHIIFLLLLYYVYLVLAIYPRCIFIIKSYEYKWARYFSGDSHNHAIRYRFFSAHRHTSAQTTHWMPLNKTANSSPHRLEVAHKWSKQTFSHVDGCEEILSLHVLLWFGTVPCHYLLNLLLEAFVFHVYPPLIHCLCSEEGNAVTHNYMMYLFLASYWERERETTWGREK